MRPKLIGIYCLTSPSGKSYIGKSVDILRRFGAYKRLNCKKQYAIYGAFIKYGVENFKFQILEECSEEELNSNEQFWIAYFGTVCPTGYNLSYGGDGGGIPTKEGIEKRTRKITGIRRSKEAIENYRKAAKNRPRPSKEVVDSLIKFNSTREYKSEWALKTADKLRKKNPNWGIGESGKNFRVVFNHDKKIIRFYGIKTIEEARKIRDDFIQKNPIPV